MVISSPPKTVQRIDLKNLLLDIDNPRLGQDTGKPKNQRELFNSIVKTFGVDDVLSSIAVSGFFEAEPIVCRDNGNGSYTVVEGNRRLCACLILAGDARAIDESVRMARYQQMQKEHGEKLFNPVPCIVFNDQDDEKLMLSYLGVRHIVSTKDWDSFAKAAWVARTVEGTDFTVKDISILIGDQTNSIKRMLEGYYFIKQLENDQIFNPSTTMKKGRGSNTDYPFSWVYTILGYTSVKKFVGFQDSDVPVEKPIPPEKVENAALIVRAMFGDESKDFKPALRDSRQLAELAAFVNDTTKVELLRNGKDLEEIGRMSKPPKEMIASIFIEVQDSLEEALGRIAKDEHELKKLGVEDLLKESARTAKLAVQVHRMLEQVQKGDEQDFTAFGD